MGVVLHTHNSQRMQCIYVDREKKGSRPATPPNTLQTAADAVGGVAGGSSNGGGGSGAAAAAASSGGGAAAELLVSELPAV